jgi:hypothetical protein
MIDYINKSDEDSHFSFSFHSSDEESESSGSESIHDISADEPSTSRNKKKQVEESPDISITEPSTSKVKETHQPKQLAEYRRKKNELKMTRIEMGKRLAESNRIKRLQKSKDEPKRKHQSKSKKAGVIFPVSKFLKKLKQMTKRKIRSTATVYMTAAVEYVTGN